MRRGFVLLNHLLDAILGSATGADQIPPRVVNFILIKLDLGLHQFQLVPELVLFVAGGLGFCRRQLLHTGLVGFEDFLSFLQLRLNLLGFLGKGGRVFRDVMQRLRKRQVHFIVRDAQNFLSKRLFLRSSGQPRQILRSFQGRPIDQGRLCGGGYLSLTLQGSQFRGLGRSD